MRITRHKSLKKSLRFFKAAFDYVDPYHVVIDPCFIETAVQYKIKLKDDLSNLLSGRVTPMVTSCVMSHLRRNGRNNPDALMAGKSFFRLKCHHDDKNPLSAADCMIAQLGKENLRHFFIAAQGDDIKARARQIPGTPVLSIHGRILMLESPSEQSRNVAQHMEQKRRLPKLSETADDDGSSVDDEADVFSKNKKKRKRKGANPLSCLPKKQQEPAAFPAPDQAVKKKRVRSKRFQPAIPASSSSC